MLFPGELLTFVWFCLVAADSVEFRLHVAFEMDQVSLSQHSGWKGEGGIVVTDRGLTVDFH